MCGINGIINFSSSRDLDNLIGAMNKALKHRGPDDQGYWLSDNRKIALGQTRLSILDLSDAGHQPMISPENGNVIVFNGEIFNFQDLNKKYLQGEKFYSSSDTETVLKLYNNLGAKFIEELDGMFAFAIWDNTKKSVVLARDLSGKKPLYFNEQNGKLSFTSEIKGLFELPWVSRDIEERVLYDFLTYNTVATPNTMFKGIAKFKPGYLMEISQTGVVRYEPFKSLKRKSIQFSSQSELEDRVFDTLERSVSKRMISDVPVGAFLSGGVDSSAIVALMRKYTEQEIKTFTVNFEHQPDYSEIQFAEKIAKRYNTNHFVQEITKNDTLDFISKITEIYDEPQSDPTAVPIYFISKLALENNIKVVMNGDGPDELFAGYSSYAKYAKLQSYFKAASYMPQFIKGIGKRVTHELKPNTPLAEMLTRLHNNQDFMWPGAGGIKEGNKEKMLSKSFLDRIGDHSSYMYIKQLKDEYAAFNDGNETEYINWLCFSGYRQAVIERFLFRADRLGMANSLEARSPFLSDEMVELALSIPSKYKIRDGVNKYILKKSLERILPHEILYRKKMGFCLPIREWAADTIGDFVGSEIDSFNKETGWFNVEEIKYQVKTLKKGNEAPTNNIWMIYFLINWHRKWF